MSEPMKQAWVDLEERFAALGRAMKERFRAAEEGPDEEVDGGEPESESGAAVRNAFERLVDAAREFGDRAGDVARDDAVKSQAKQAAGSLNDALSATVNVIGEHVGGLFKRGEKNAAKPEAASPDPDAPGTYVDDENAANVAEPNEPG